MYLDDSPYTFRILSQGQSCEVSLTGPADPLTGQQFTRTIRLDYDSPRIRFIQCLPTRVDTFIFWTYGPQLRPAADGTVTLGRSDKEPHPFYMEAELNSPMVQLYPGESHSFDTEWFPTRGDSGIQAV